MKSFKIIASLFLMMALGSVQAKTANQSDTYIPKIGQACLIPVKTKNYIQYINVNAIRHVGIYVSRPEKISISLLGNHHQESLAINYPTEKDAEAALDKLVRLINACGQLQ